VAPAGGGTPGGTPRAAAGDASAAAQGPGPNRLYEIAYDQFRRGSFATARTGFTDLLTRFPTSDLAPDAAFYVAESFASERNAAAADSAYRAVVTRYPQSPRAATALYKRAQASRDAAESRTLYQQLVRDFPRSDEAELAREALKQPARPAPARRP
ncbi:tetratricopeptide repeat protein, partial [Roseisolibacter sp. H3M3-2]|uniref:tetratricopeptide repeat protein n=1 Tax=Roseisolibacter sp. H3M3-2 TaxID=3031323 RepID=UPI0023DB0969